MRTTLLAGLVLALTLIAPAADHPAHAQGLGGKAAREAAEFLMRKFGKEAAEEGAEKLAGRIASLASRHGDDAILAVRRVGPKAFRLADDAGEHAPQVIRLLSRHGDDAARVLGNPRGMTLFARYGDEAAEIMMKHKGIAEPLVEGLGTPAIKALVAVGPRNGRRLAMMAQGGELKAIGRTPELLDVIARHGDKACDFIYRNRVVLAGSAALTAFLVNPQPYLDGTNTLVETVAANTVKPAVQAAGSVAREAAGFARWILTIAFVALLLGLGWAVKCRAFEKPWVKAAARVAWNHVGGRWPARTLKP